MSETFDVVVVGAGSAGSVVTRRLVDAGLSVLLVEAGGPDDNPAIHDPARQKELWHSRQDWNYYTVPQRNADRRRLHLPRGKVLGGSHALNAMIWVRGAPSDFDHWAALGNDGWSWHEVLPVYRKIENRVGADADPGEGLLDIVAGEPLHPIQQSIIDAAVEIGLEHNPDYNGGHLDGVAQQQITVRDGKRLNTWMAYAAPVTRSANLTVRTGARVHRLLRAGTRITGIELETGQRVEQAQADQVVLASGALDSPRVLLRSGIGPASELRELGIEVVADVPGVGRNLHDHLLAPLIYATDRAVEPPRAGRSATQTHLFWRSLPGLPAPDTQPIHFSVPMYEPWMVGPDRGFSLMAGMVSPRSRGSVRLSGALAGDPLLIDPNVLAVPADMDSLIASLRQCREIGRAAALAEGWGARELYPGPAVEDEKALRQYVRKSASTYHHQVGTCKMGIDEQAVVDPRLRAYGVTGLRVADASIMPRITTGNTNAPAVMIGERMAEFLLEEAAR